jgi:hypothetical protein
MTSMYGLRLYTYRFYEIDAFVAYQDDVLSCSFQQENVDMVAGRLCEASPDFDRAHAFFFWLYISPIARPDAASTCASRVLQRPLVALFLFFLSSMSLHLALRVDALDGGRPPHSCAA